MFNELSHRRKKERKFIKNSNYFIVELERKKFLSTPCHPPAMFVNIFSLDANKQKKLSTMLVSCVRLKIFKLILNQSLNKMPKLEATTSSPR